MPWGEYTTLKSAGIPAHTHKRDLCKKRYICWCEYKGTVIITSKTLLAGRWKAFKVPSTLQTKIIHHSLHVFTSHSGQTNSISGIIKLHLASELTKYDLLLVCWSVLQSLYSSKQAHRVLNQYHTILWVVSPRKHLRLMRDLIWLFAMVRESTGRCPLNCAERSLIRARRRADDSCELP